MKMIFFVPFVPFVVHCLSVPFIHVLPIRVHPR